MSIRFKLLGLLLLILITFCGIGIYGISIYQKTLSQEEKIRDKTNQAVELSHQTESSFHSQLNAWKNVLLRGSDSSNYHKYLTNYYQSERNTRKSIRQLNELIIQLDNPSLSSNLLLTEHLNMGRKFREAIRLFNSTDVNPGRVTDLYVAGVEDTPSKLLDTLIEQLINNRIDQIQSLAEHRQQQESFLLYIIVALLIVSISSFVWLTDRNIAKPAEMATYLTKVINNAEHAANFGTWEWDIENDAHYWSEGLYKLLGITKNQKPSLKQFLNSLTEENRDAVHLVIQNAQQNQVAFEVEANIQQQTDNIVRTLLIRGEVTKQPKTAKIYMSSIVHDITDYKQAQRQIELSESKYRTLFESAGDAILLIENNQFIDCNLQTQSTFGCTREQFIGKTPMDFSPPTQYSGRDSHEIAEEKLRNVLHTGIATNFNWLHKKLDGTLFDAEVTLTRTNLDDKVYLQGIVRDVSIRRRTEEIVKNIATGISSTTGENFFNQLVIYMSKMLETKYAFIGVIDSENPNIVNTISLGEDGFIGNNISYKLKNTPCENVVGQSICTHPSEVQTKFPDDKMLQEMGIESYMGAPLFDSNKKPLGLIVLLDVKPLEQTDFISEILQIFAVRAGAELERLHAEQTIQKQSKQMRASLDAMPGVFYMFDDEGYLVYYNKGYQEIFNLSDKDMEHRHALEVVHPDDKILAQTAIDDVLKKGKTVQLEIRGITDQAKGTVIHMLATGSRVILDDKPFLVGAAADITDRIKAQEDLFMKERAMEAATEGIVITDASDENRILYVNHSMEIITGYDRHELLGQNPRILQGAETNSKTVAKIRSAISEQQACRVEILNYRKDGAKFWNEITITPVQNKNGDITHYIGTQLDITNRRTTEEALRRSQKMEAIGQLAGGIAHDFNNQLGIVVGYLDFLHDYVDNDEAPSRWVQTATKSALRCTDLTRQLLSFSRHKTKETTVTNFNTELEKMKSLITGALTPAITLKIFNDDNLWPVATESGEFQDVILNLIINARDAMPNGGELVIETTNKRLDSEYVSLTPSLAPGEYAQISVSDTGCGMNKETQERIFEPFFTTKPEGKGTGLGLAMVYGFAKRYNGEVKLYSEPGIGTTFHLYLPHSMTGMINKGSELENTDILPKGNETILVVDDEIELLHLAQQYLHNLGYKVLIADKPQEALELIKQNPEIDMLFSDVVMPGKMNGFALSEKAVKINPHLKVLLTSGFTTNTIAVNGQKKFETNLLHKPYRKAELAKRIRLSLDNVTKEGSLNSFPQDSSTIIVERSVLVIDDDKDVRDLLKYNLDKLGYLTLLASNSRDATSIFQQALSGDKQINIVILDLNLPGDMDGKKVAEKLQNMDSHVKIIISSGDSESPEMLNYEEYGFQGALEKSFHRENIQQVLEAVLDSSNQEFIS